MANETKSPQQALAPGLREWQDQTAQPPPSDKRTQPFMTKEGRTVLISRSRLAK